MPEHLIDILLVEDNPNDIELAMYAFTKNSIAERVFIVRDGIEAIEFLFCEGRYINRNAKNGPRIILLDLKIPNIDGIQLLETIKQDIRTKSIPVIALTTSHEHSDVFRCYAAGVNSYVVKPVDFQEFSEAIRLITHYWLKLNLAQGDR